MKGLVGGQQRCIYVSLRFLGCLLFGWYMFSADFPTYSKVARGLFSINDMKITPNTHTEQGEKLFDSICVSEDSIQVRAID